MTPALAERFDLRVGVAGEFLEDGRVVLAEAGGGARRWVRTVV